MGWLWASSSAEKAPKPEQNKPVTPPTTSTAASSSPSSSSTDPEIQKFLELFQGDNSGKPDATNSSSSSSSPPPPSSTQSNSSWSPSSSWLSTRSSPNANHIPDPTPSADAPLSDPLAESLLPADMSCRQAFDQAWACNSMGGQWNAVYRYGEMRSCSEHWDDFWFCMRTRGYSGEMREKLIREHYRKKELAKYGPGKPSSEDIWQSRSHKVEPGTVFTEPIE